MFKPTPNPPEPTSQTDPTSPYESLDSRKLHDAAERALDYYLTAADLCLPSDKDAEPMYLANPKFNTESLLVDASQNLGSATAMLRTLADTLEPSKRKTVLGIAQVVMLAELAVGQALDHVEVT